MNGCIARWAPLAQRPGTRMNHKDLCFLGLIALAYVYLDARIEETRAPQPAQPPQPPQPARLPYGGIPGTSIVLRSARSLVPREPGCPRDQAHRITRRADGAIWCRGCDEAYYPSTADALMAMA